MSDDKGRFLRVYFDRLERDHPDVWFDPTCLSTYVRLLALSEKAWPSMPELPLSVRRADLAKLVEGEMLQFLPNHRFVLKGWVNERTERARIARENVGKRPDRTTVPTTVDTTVPTVVPSTVQPVRAPASFSFSSSSSTEGGPGETDDRDCLDTYYELTRFRPWGIWSGDKLRGAAREYGDANVTVALRTESDQDPDVDTLMDRAFARLAKEADKAKRTKPPRPRIVKPAVDEKARNALIRQMQSGEMPA